MKTPPAMTIQDVERLIRNDETRTLELKKSTGELKDGMHSACAFLNTAGGWLVFGIVPTTMQIVGQQVTDNTRREIAHELSKIEPVVSVEVEYIEMESKQGFFVVAIHFDKALFREEPYVYDGRPYYRVESTTKVMPQAMYQKLLRKKDARRQLWEEETNPDLTLDKIDEDSFWRLVRAGVEAGRIPERMLHKSISEVVDSMHLSSNGVLKNAMAALFVQEPYASIQFHLKMARFSGTTKHDFVDNRRVIGNIFQLYDAGMDFFFKHLNLSGTFVDGQPERVEALTIPYKALRECLLNALAHRIYHLFNSFVSIAIYDDRVEVENSGALPEDLSLEDLMKPHSSHAQNPLIAQVMYYGKYLETWGRGIELMKEQCEQAGVSAPQFEVERGCFRVVFMRADYSGTQDGTQGVPQGVPQGLPQDGTQGGTQDGTQGGTQDGTQRQLTDDNLDKWIESQIKENPKITTEELAKLSQKGVRTIKRRISMMKHIRYVGSGYSGHWEVYKEQS